MDVLFVSDLSVDQPSITFYNTSTGVQLKCIKNAACQPNGYAFVNDDLLLVALYDKQLIHIYDTFKDQLLKKIVCPGKISCLAVSPDGYYCIVALVEKLYIWQLPTGDLINILTKHYQKVNAIRFTIDRSFFVTCADDGSVLIWDFASTLQPIDTSDPENTNGQPYHTITLHSLPVKDVYITTTGSRSLVVSASTDKTCAIFDISSGQTLCHMTIGIACCAVTMDILERYLYVGTKTGKIFLINMIDQTPGNINENDKSNCIDGHSKDIRSLSVSMNSSLLVSSSSDGNVKLWDVHSKQCLRTFSFKGEVTNATFLHFPKFLQETYQPPPFPTPVSNFKRVVTNQSYRIFQAKSLDEFADDVIPVILKDLPNTDAYKFLHGGEEEDAKVKKLFEQAWDDVQENEDKPQQTDLSQASRKELLEKIDDFKTMTSGFYELAKDKLLSTPKSTADQT